jgi:hypothetical protein
LTRIEHRSSLAFSMEFLRCQGWFHLHLGTINRNHKYSYISRTARNHVHHVHFRLRSAMNGQNKGNWVAFFHENSRLKSWLSRKWKGGRLFIIFAVESNLNTLKRINMIYDRQTWSAGTSGRHVQEQWPYSDTTTKLTSDRWRRRVIGIINLLIKHIEWEFHSRPSSSYRGADLDGFIIVHPIFPLLTNVNRSTN